MGIYLYTASELRERPDGWTFDRHLATVRGAQNDRIKAMERIVEAVQRENRAGLKASEQRDFDAHQDECSRLAALQKALENSSEGREVDYSQGVLPTVQYDTGGKLTRSLYHDEQGNPTETETRRGWDNQGRHTGGGHTYRRDDAGWLQDLAAITRQGDPAAQERQARNAREFADAVKGTEARALTSYTTGAASDLVPPAWALDLLATVARPARVFADNIGGGPLPPNSMTIEVPRIVTGTSVAAQGTENTTVSDTNVGTDTIAANVHTLAGKQVLSYQLVDQSPLNVEQLIIQDLGAEMAHQVDLFALSSNATGKYGALNQAGISTVAYTDASPTVPKLYTKIADAIQRIATSRYYPADKIVMHPRRWAWIASALDPAGRPLMLPESNHPQNAIATQAGVVAQGAAGTIQGLPVFLDACLPINGGTGTNQDPIIVMHSSDLLLWESGPRITADRISMAGQLSMQIVLWEYAAIQCGRYPSSVSVVAGSGLAAPSFA